MRREEERRRKRMACGKGGVKIKRARGKA